MKKAFTLIELLIVVAIIAILAAIAVPNFLEAQTRAKVSRVAADQRSYATALETYYIDNNTYPLHAPRTPGVVGAITGAAPTRNTNGARKAAAGEPEAPYNNLASFAVSPTAAHAIGLTSPVSYLNTYSADAFADWKQATFGYATASSQFLIWSEGPDAADNLWGRGATPENHKSAEFIVAGGQSLPSPFLLTGPSGSAPKPPGAVAGNGSFTYDPTNGTTSAGDVYRTK